MYLDTYDYTGEGIIINKTNGSGKAMVYYSYDKYNVGETTIHFKSMNTDILTKYIYYYLFHNIELLQKYFKGANHKSIVIDDLFKIQIPIPSFKQQQKIIDNLDNLYEIENKQYEKAIENNKKKAYQFITNMTNQLEYNNSSEIINEVNEPINAVNEPINEVNEPINEVNETANKVNKHKKKKINK